MIQYRYRGFSDNTGQWAYGDLIHNQKVTLTGLEPRSMIGGYEIDPATVGISSGLKDSDGKEIFEGDILESAGGSRIAIVRDSEAPCLVGISQIAWTYHKDNLKSEPRYLARNAASMKVIGNIHQNPELMYVDIKAGKR